MERDGGSAASDLARIPCPLFICLAKTEEGLVDLQRGREITSVVW